MLSRPKRSIPFAAVAVGSLAFLVAAAPARFAFGLIGDGVSTTQPAPLGFVGHRAGQGGIVRAYHTDLSFPTEGELSAAEAGDRVVLTFKADPTAVVTGEDDPALEAAASAMSVAGGDWLVGYWHEPEDDMTPARYQRAFQHVAAIFGRAANVRTIAVFMAWTFTTGDGDTWYPGDDAVDVIGVDGYNWMGCLSHGGDVSPTGWSRSFADVFKAADAFAVAHAKPLIATEFGTPDDPSHPGAKARWLRDAGQWIDAHPEFIGGTYFNYDLTDGFRCNWALNRRQLSVYRDVRLSLD